MISGFVAYVPLMMYAAGTNDVFYGFVFDVLLPVAILGLPAFIGVCFGRIFGVTVTVYGGFAAWLLFIGEPGSALAFAGSGLLVSLTMSFLAERYSLLP